MAPNLNEFILPCEKKQKNYKEEKIRKNKKAKKTLMLCFFNAAIKL